MITDLVFQFPPRAADWLGWRFPVGVIFSSSHTSFPLFSLADSTGDEAKRVLSLKSPKHDSIFE
jgi:hypothetical protein